MEFIRFIEPSIDQTFDKKYYKSCIINNKLNVTVGDIAVFRSKYGAKTLSYAKIISMYEDLSIRTMNSAGSTLSPFKGEILWFFSKDEVPLLVFSQLEDIYSNKTFLVPLISKDSIIRGSLDTIELKDIYKTSTISFPPFRDETNTCLIVSGFDSSNIIHDPQISLQKSIEFSIDFLKKVTKLITEAYNINRRHSYIKTNFKINEWFDSNRITIVYSESIFSISQPSERGKLKEPIAQKLIIQRKRHRNSTASTQSIDSNTITTCAEHEVKPVNSSSLGKRKSNAAKIKRDDSDLGKNKINESTKNLTPTIIINAKDTCSSESTKEFTSPLPQQKTPTKSENVITPKSSTPKISDPLSCKIIKGNIPKKDSCTETKFSNYIIHSSTTEVSPLQHREFEHEKVSKFIENSLKNNKSGCCYISGLPGSGKTATLMRICEKYKLNKNSNINCIYINCANFVNSNQVLVEFSTQVLGQKLTFKKAYFTLDYHFKKNPKQFTIFIVDEFDHLCSSESHVWYNICEWTTQDTSKLIFIPISNTIDLPERLMTKQTCSRFGCERVFFNPYSFKELSSIMKSKISHEFDEDAIMLISRKIAQVAGDFRKCFSVCVKAKEHADKKSHAKVLVEDVEESLNQLLQKDKILVSSLSVKSKLILKHILKLSNNPQKETGIQEIYDEQKKYCAAKNEPAPNFDHILKMVNSLTSNNLIIQITPNGIHSKFKPNFHADSLD